MSPNTIIEYTVSLFPQDGAGGWNSKGCRVSPMSNGNKTICLCDHLTHFGILMVRLVFTLNQLETLSPYNCDSLIHLNQQFVLV